MNIKLIFLFNLWLLAISVTDAQNKNYNLKLSDPSKEGFLKINVRNASIKVEGHDNAHIALSIIDDRKGKDKKFGEAEFFFQITEHNNELTIVNRDRRKVKGLGLALRVPKDFSINVYTYFGSQIEVSNLDGEIEATGYFTDINIKDIKKSVIANTNHGDINVEIGNISTVSNHFISTYKGDLFVFLPQEAKATLLMDNYFGNYHSDFKLTLNTDKELNARDDFVRRDMNGGGAKIKLINYFGEISILAKK